MASAYPVGATVRRRSASSGREALVLAALATYVLVLTVLPLGRLLYEALLPGRGGEILGVLLAQWRTPQTQTALLNTVEASALATLVSVAIGAVTAFLLALTDIRGKTALTFVALLPLLVPSQIAALAWIELTRVLAPILALFGSAPVPGTASPLYSKGGIVLVMGVEHSTLVFLAVRAALCNLPRDLIEAARLGGAHPLRVSRSVIVPLALPAILAGALLAFVASVGNFGVPALLGIPGRYTMLTTLIYQHLQGFGPRVLGEAAALALGLAVLAVAGLLLRALLVRRRASEGSSAPLEPFQLERGRTAVAASLWTMLTVIAILPLLALLASSLSPAPLRSGAATLQNYRFALLEHDATIRAFANSFLLAFLTAAVSVAVALPLAYLATLRRSLVARVLDFVADVPDAVPGTVLAVAVILLFLPPLPLLQVSFYGTIGIILMAYLARFLAFVLRPTMAAIERVNRNLDEAAQLAGAPVLMRLRAVILPEVAPSVAAGALLIFMTALNELTVSALLWSTGRETLGVVVLALQHEGNSQAAAAVSVISVMVTLALAAVATVLGRRLPEGMVPWRA